MYHVYDPNNPSRPVEGDFGYCGVQVAYDVPMVEDNGSLGGFFFVFDS